MRSAVALFIALTSGIAIAESAATQTFDSVGQRFKVSDGDTVKYGRQRVRLFGIDAPERAQRCDGGAWRPGPLATKALIDFIGGRSVICHQIDYDARTKRPVAECFAGGDDLQRKMVMAGWAWAFTRYSDRYALEQRKAVENRAGVHAHRCLPPWEWRARQRSPR